MGIARYEQVGVYDLTYNVNAFGETDIVKTLKFESRPVIKEVRTDLQISDKYRVYQNLIYFTFNYTPYVRQIADSQDSYSMTWRGKDWRIESAVESNDRMKVTFLCYHNDPATKV